MGSTTPDKTTIALGLVTVGVGSIPLLAMAGILPRETPQGDPAPAWMGWLIGAAFVSAGLIVIMRGALNVSDRSEALPATAPWPLRLTQQVLSLGIVFSLAAMFTWVGFGPGPRHFSIGVDGLWLRGFGSGAMLGRVAFGFGAILMWWAAIAITRVTLRSWRQ